MIYFLVLGQQRSTRIFGVSSIFGEITLSIDLTHAYKKTEKTLMRVMNPVMDWCLLGDNRHSLFGTGLLSKG